MLHYQDSGMDAPRTGIPIVILIEPSSKFSQHMSVLRNQLKKQNIDYQEETGFDRIDQLTNNRNIKSVVIINNTDLADQQIPKDLKENKPFFQVYCIPQKSNRFESLNNAEDIISKIEPSRGSVRKASGKGRDKGIRMKSVKKMMDRVSEKGNGKGYEKVLLYGGHTESKDFLDLATSLMTQPYVQQIKKENDLSNYKTSKVKKNLLIIEFQAAKSINNFLNEAGLKNKTDLIILGVKKTGTLHNENVVLATNSASQILLYLHEIGFDISNAETNYVQISRGENDNHEYERIQYAGEALSPRERPNNRNDSESLNSVNAVQNSTKKNDSTGDKILSEIPYAGLMATKYSDEQEHDNMKKALISGESQKKPKIKKINKKSSKIDSNNMSESPRKQSGDEFLLGGGNGVKKSLMADKKSVMTWDVFIPRGEKSYITHPARQNPSFSSVGKPKSQNFSSDFQQDSQTSIKQSENKNSNLNYGIIPQVSDEYRGSNRQSYIGDEQSRNLRYGSLERNTLNDVLNENNNILEEEKSHETDTINNKSMPAGVLNKTSSATNIIQSNVGNRSEGGTNNRMKEEYERAKQELLNRNNQESEQKKPSKVISNMSKYEGPSTYYQKQSQKTITTITNNQLPANNYQQQASNNSYRQQAEAAKSNNREERRVIGNNRNIQPAQYISSTKNISTNNISSAGRVISDPRKDIQTGNTSLSPNSYQMRGGNNEGSSYRYQSRTVQNNKVNVVSNNTEIRRYTNTISPNNAQATPSTNTPNRYMDSRYLTQKMKDEDENKSYRGSDNQKTSIYTNIRTPQNQKINSSQATRVTTINGYTRESGYNRENVYNRESPFNRDQLKAQKPMSPNSFQNVSNTSNMDKSKTDQSKSRILDAKSVDLSKYERTVDQNGRVVYIDKTSKSIEKQPATQYRNYTAVTSPQPKAQITSPYNTYSSDKSTHPTNIISSSNRIITNRTQIQQNKNLIPSAQQNSQRYLTSNYNYRSDDKSISNENQRRGINPPKTDYKKEVKVEKYSDDNPYKHMEGVKVYTREEYERKMGGGIVEKTEVVYKKDDKFSSSEKNLLTPREQSKNQLYSQNYISSSNSGHSQASRAIPIPSSNTINTNNTYSANFSQQANPITRYSTPQNTYSPSGSTAFKEQQIVRRQVKATTFQPYNANTQNFEQIKKIQKYSEPVVSPNIISNQRQIGQQERFSKNITKKDETHRNILEKNHIPMGYESRSSSNSSGVVKRSKFNNTSQYDRKVIKQNSNIKQNKQSSDNENKYLLQNSHTDKEGLPTVYVDFKHKDMKNHIENNFPGKYNIRYFRDLDELNYDRDAIVMLHPDSDYIGQNLPTREFQSVYMLGNTSKVPNGTIRIQQKDLQYIL